MDNKTNALSELAERLHNGLFIDGTLKAPVVSVYLRAEDILMAQRIIAELAKVDGMERISFECLASMLSECRDIAEE